MEPLKPSELRYEIFNSFPADQNHRDTLSMVVEAMFWTITSPNSPRRLAELEKGGGFLDGLFSSPDRPRTMNLNKVKLPTVAVLTNGWHGVWLSFSDDTIFVSRPFGAPIQPQIVPVNPVDEEKLAGVQIQGVEIDNEDPNRLRYSASSLVRNQHQPQSQLQNSPAPV